MTRTTAARYVASLVLALTTLLVGCDTNTTSLHGGKNDGGKTDAGANDAATSDTSEPATACTQAGGSCVAVYPGSCASGITNGLSCGSGVGTECCMPGGAGGIGGTGGASGRGGVGGIAGASGAGGAGGTGGSSGAGGKTGSGGSSGSGGATSVPVNTCTQAGGTCVTGAPGSCSGTTNSLSCGPAIGGICCVPGGVGGSSGTGGSGGRGGSGAGGRNGTGGNSGTGGTTSVPVNACTQAGGSCVAVYPGSCASGITTSLSCGSGVGVECCMPGGGGDGGIDGGDQAPAALCTTTGGHVTSTSCCTSSADYPDTCRGTGGCSCSPANSKTISACDCGASRCFDQTLGCVSN